MTVDSGHLVAEGRTIEAPSESNLPLGFFYYAGASSLLGWNVVLTFAHGFDCDLFQGKLWGGGGWPLWSAFGYAASQNLIQGLLSSRTLAARFPIGHRCTCGSAGMVAAMVGILLLRLYAPAGEDTTFVAGMALIALVGSSGAVFQSATFAMAGAISPRLMQAMMVGQGLAGVASGAIGFIFGSSRLVLELSFLAAAVFLAAGPFIFCAVSWNPHVRPILEGGKPAAATPSASQADGARPEALLPAGAAVEESCVGGPRSSLRILRESAWPQALTTALVFGVTFTVFPGVTARWRPSEHVTYLIATFQLLDVVGRAAPEAQMLRIRNGVVVSCFAALRLLFIPAFMAVQRAEASWARNSWLQFPLMVLFAFTNGYVSTLSMMLGPSQKGVEANEQALVGTMMSFFCCFGILGGSLLALPTQIGLESVNQCP